MKYKCECIIHEYDGIRTNVKNVTIEKEADNEEDAMSKIRKEITENYRKKSHVGLSSLLISIKE
jgi:hypothetical protein